MLLVEIPNMTVDLSFLSFKMQSYTTVDIKNQYCPIKRMTITNRFYGQGGGS